MPSELLCIIDCRRGVENAAQVASSLLRNFSHRGSLTIIFASHCRVDILGSMVSEQVGKDCSCFISSNLSEPGKVPSGAAAALLHTALAACESLLYKDRIVVICDAAARAVNSWDIVVRKSCPGGAVVGFDCLDNKSAALVVPRGFKMESLTTELRPILNNDVSFLPAAILPTLCISAKARTMAALCKDAIGLVGDKKLKMSQLGLMLTLSAHRCEMPRMLSTELAMHRAFVAKVHAQWIHENFKSLTCSYQSFERYIGIDVENKKIFGQGIYGLTRNPSAHECLAKTGYLLSELRASKLPG